VNPATPVQVLAVIVLPVPITEYHMVRTVRAAVPQVKPSLEHFTFGCVCVLGR